MVIEIGKPGFGKSKAIKRMARKHGIKVREIKLKKVKRKNFKGLPTW